jgi:hypothetical protein
LSKTLSHDGRAEKGTSTENHKQIFHPYIYMMPGTGEAQGSTVSNNPKGGKGSGENGGFQEAGSTTVQRSGRMADMEIDMV